jgi:hypothetical protein
VSYFCRFRYCYSRMQLKLLLLYCCVMPKPEWREWIVWRLAEDVLSLNPRVTLGIYFFLFFLYFQKLSCLFFCFVVRLGGLMRENKVRAGYSRRESSATFPVTSTYASCSLSLPFSLSLSLQPIVAFCYSIRFLIILCNLIFSPFFCSHSLSVSVCVFVSQ